MNQDQNNNEHKLTENLVVLVVLLVVALIVAITDHYTGWIGGMSFWTCHFWMLFC